MCNGKEVLSITRRPSNPIMEVRASLDSDQPEQTIFFRAALRPSGHGAAGSGLADASISSSG